MSPNHATDQVQFSIDLSGTNDWENVELLRGAVQNYVTVIFRDDEQSQNLSMIAAELLENAIKYGAWGADAQWFHLRVWSDGSQVQIAVQSPIRSVDDEDVHRVKEMIDWIKSFPSAEDAYAARLLAVAARARGETMSQLGLVRIAYEGACALEAEVLERSLRVTASLPAPSPY